jgi:hypothetical protein
VCCSAEALDLVEHLLHVHRQPAGDLVRSKGRGGAVEQFSAAGRLRGDRWIE